MPINGVTTTEMIDFRQIGQIRKGAPKPKDKNMPGADLHCFRFIGADDLAQEMFDKAYGEEPTRINFALPFPEINQNFEAYMEAYVASRLVHRCDGSVIWERNKRTGLLEPTNKPCPTRDLPEGHKEKCRPSGRLRMIIPELKRVAYVTFVTTSIIDIGRIFKQLAGIRALAGQISGIPLVISRVPEKITVKDKNGSRRVEKHMVHIEVDPEFASRRLLAQSEHAMMIASNPNLLSLPAPMPRLLDTSTGEILDDLHDDRFPDTNKDCYAGMDGYHPNSSDSDEEEVEEADAEFEEESPKPAPAPEESALTVQQRRAYVRRLTALWSEEESLGGGRPKNELSMNFQDMTKADFVKAGETVKERITKLRELLGESQAG